MNTKLAALAATLALLMASPSLADQKGNKADKGNGQGHAQSSQGKCPPGLAKKGNGCQPPGKAKKAGKDGDAAYHDYRHGDRLPDDYIVFLDPRDYAFGPSSLLVRSGDYLYLTDRTTGRVLQPMGPVTDWGWNWEDTDFKNCPPGLAKKNPPCVPPGQARQGAALPDPYRIGAHLPDGYRVVIDPGNGDPNDDIIYTRRGDTIYRVDRQNDQVIDLIGTIADLLK